VLPHKESIGLKVLEYDSRILSVLRRVDAISGPFRKPALELIAGSSETETTLSENGCAFHIDPMKVMFSLGNKAERERMSLLGTGELVVDMFAGIGQFTIPMAVHAAPHVIHAIEWNPEAFHYLEKNISENRVSHIVTPHNGDAAIIATEVSQGQADRVLMGLFPGTATYLDKAFECLRPGGVLHFHEIFARPEASKRATKIVEDAALRMDKQVTILSSRIIKSFNPQIDHVVLDVQVT
jgi:tRNA wybutosine-synthesizing protein 2